jgi:hypothetical protein
MRVYSIIITFFVTLHLNLMRAAADKRITNYFQWRAAHHALLFHFNIQIFTGLQQLHLFIYLAHIIIFITKPLFLVWTNSAP